MENSYIISGNKPLKGEVILSGAKNIALKVLIATLLFDSKVTLHNIPRIADIDKVMKMLNDLGAKAEFVKANTVVVDPTTLNSKTVDLLTASKVRASFLLFAPLLYKFNEADIPNPGGCRLGARSIDRVIEGLRLLGIKVDYDSSTGYYHAKMNQKPHGSYRFPKPSHTGTELMIMMSVFGKDKIVIENAALEPEIDDLIAFLNKGGAKIRRENVNIIIEGVNKLEQKEPYAIATDRIEAITYAVAGIATGGEVTVSPVPESYIAAFNEKLKEAGGTVEKIDELTWKFSGKNLKAINVETAPYPGFATDWQPLMAILLTQASGKSIIHESIFENRFSFVDELRRLGAKIEFIDYPVENPTEHYAFNYEPGKEYKQTIEITGAQQLHGGVMTVADLRAGATLAIAALIAKGDSYLQGIEHLERGYEDFVGKIRALGGEIKRI